MVVSSNVVVLVLILRLFEVEDVMSNWLTEELSTDIDSSCSSEVKGVLVQE